jgi:ribosome-associated protein
MKPKKSAALDLVKLCCRVLEDKKGENLTVLDVADQSSITDFLIIATATSEPHLRALRVELEKALDAEKVRIVGIETGQESGWMVIDAFDVMIHLFFAETRERFGLERLWRDATEVSVARLLAAPAAKRSKTPSAKRPKRSKRE